MGLWANREPFSVRFQFSNLACCDLCAVARLFLEVRSFMNRFVEQARLYDNSLGGKLVLCLPSPLRLNQLARRQGSEVNCWPARAISRLYVGVFSQLNVVVEDRDGGVVNSRSHIAAQF
jgi:hypothetical protein